MRTILTRISRHMYDEIEQLQKQIKQQTGVQVTMAQASSAYARLRNTKQIRIKLARGGVLEISHE